MTIFAITNQKGGVGKTTTSVNLSAALAELSQRVLLIDLDPQGNATMGAGVDKNQLEQSTLELLLGEAGPEEIVQSATTGTFDVLPSNADLTAAEVELLSVPERERRLACALDGISAQYDYILVDCPPSLNMLTLNALVAADGVLIPVQCEYYALEGLTSLMNTIARIRQRLNPALRIEGLLRTMYDSRITLANEVSSQLMAHFGSRVYQTVIPRNVRLAEAPSHGRPILDYDRHSRGAVAYLDLAKEMLKRHGRDIRRAGVEPQNCAG